MKLAVAVAISVVGLIIAFRNVDGDQIVVSIQKVNGWYILAAVTLMVTTVWLRAWRWQYILAPIKPIGIHPLFASTMIGYFGNSVLPFRLGELLRAYSVARDNGLRTSTALGTILLERVIDMIGLVAVTIIFFAVYPFPPKLKLAGWIAIAFTLTLVLALIVIATTEDRIKSRVFGRKIFDNRLGQKLVVVINNLIAGMISLRSSRHFLAVTVLTVVMWIAYYVQTYLVVMSLDMEVSWVAVGVALIATTLVITVPSAPGYIGTYHATAVLVMEQLFGVPLADAQAFAVLVHAIGFVPFATIGFVYFLNSSVHLKDINSDRGTVEENA